MFFHSRFETGHPAQWIRSVVEAKKSIHKPATNSSDSQASNIACLAQAFKKSPNIRQPKSNLVTHKGPAACFSKVLASSKPNELSGHCYGLSISEKNSGHLLVCLHMDLGAYH